MAGLRAQIALVSLHELEVTAGSEPVQVAKGHLLHRRGLDAKVLHGQDLVVAVRLRIVLLLRHGGDVVLAPQLHEVGGEARGALVLEDLGAGDGRGLGHVGHDGLLAGDVVHELSQLLVGEVLGSEAVDRPALVLLRLVHDLGDGVGDVGHVHGLGEGVAAVDEGDDGEPAGDVGEPVEEAVLGPEELGRPDDGGPRVGLADGLLPGVLGPGPLGLGVRGGRQARHVDEVVHLHLRAELGYGPGDVDVALLEGVVGLVLQKRELVLVGQGLGLVVLADEVDDDVGVGDDLGHGVAVAGRVEDEAGAAEVEHGPEVPELELVPPLADVAEDAVGPEVAAHVPAEEAAGAEDGHLHPGVRGAAAGAGLVVPPVREVGRPDELRSALGGTDLRHMRRGCSCPPRCRGGQPAAGYSGEHLMVCALFYVFFTTPACCMQCMSSLLLATCSTTTPPRKEVVLAVRGSGDAAICYYVPPSAMVTIDGDVQTGPVLELHVRTRADEAKANRPSHEQKKNRGKPRHRHR